MTSVRVRWRRLIRPPFFSPHGFVVRAGWLVIFFAFCHLFGLREHTAFLSGTPGSVHTSLAASAVLGVIYMAAYYGFVLIVPILLIAAAIFHLLEKWLAGRESATPTAFPPGS